jgi:glycyl-tRNA synthetase beta chain
VKILVDLPDLGVGKAVDLTSLLHEAYQSLPDFLALQPGRGDAWRDLPLRDFFAEREAHLFELRGYRADEGRAVAGHWAFPLLALKRIDALSKARSSDDFGALAALFKRVKNITKGFDGVGGAGSDDVRTQLKEPAELALAEEMDRRWPAIGAALANARYTDAMREIGSFRQPVDRFFIDVMVMTDDPVLREARLTLLSRLRDRILEIGDIAEMAPEEIK